jgi:hypothetical protein
MEKKTHPTTPHQHHHDRTTTRNMNTNSAIEKTNINKTKPWGKTPNTK